MDELTKLTTEIASYCADDLKNLTTKGAGNAGQRRFYSEQQAELLERQINAARVKHCGLLRWFAKSVTRQYLLPVVRLSVSHALCFLPVSL